MKDGDQTEKYELGFWKHFFDKEFINYSKKFQKQIVGFMNEFQENPKSSKVNIEPIKGISDKNMKSARVKSRNFRAVVYLLGNNKFALLHIDTHDDAYEWAKNKFMDFNKNINGIQLYEMVDQDIIMSETNMGQPALFDGISDDQLVMMGVPEKQLAYVHSFTSKEDFQKANGKIPEFPYENLSLIVEGAASVSEVISEIIDKVKGQPQENNDGKSDMLNSSVTKQSFFVNPSESELQEFLEGSLEEWRVFLHPSQREAATKDYNGPALVLGGAGTGKTVVAMHRAKHLATMCEKGQKVLMTSYTTNLVDDIEKNLQKLCPEEMGKIDVINLDKWASRFLKGQNSQRALTYDDDELDDWWDTAVGMAGQEAHFGPDFYRKEWERVVTNMEEYTLDQYIKADRSSEGIELDAQEREKAWKVFEEYMKQMKLYNKFDKQMAIHESTKILKENRELAYEHVIVDEGQDLSDNEYRLIRALAGEQHKNDIFITGDSHQRIYENIPTLSKCGINIEDRVTHLLINYRTTDQIQKYAISLLKGIQFDDLNGGVDAEDIDVSITYGEEPYRQNFDDQQSEINFLIDEINLLHDSGVALNDICVVANTNSLVGQYKKSLTEFNPYEIKTNNPEERGIGGLRVATMHRVKGLEFQYIFIVAANDKVIPSVQALNEPDPLVREQALTNERSLLYVAITRAQRGVYITSYGKQSQFLN